MDSKIYLGIRVGKRRRIRVAARAVMEDCVRDGSGSVRSWLSHFYVLYHTSVVG
jgi:hypothetical protein